jgi:phosphopantetheinyl transferase (holo-ACP synthase)
VPIINYDKFDDVEIAVWKIDEDEDFLKNLAEIDNEDFEFCSKFKLEIRRKQFYVARILANKLTKSNSKIKYNKSGKPFFEHQKFHLSITHCKNYLAIIISKKYEVGIDLEEITDRVHSIKHKFMNDFELLKMDKKNETLELYMNWCAKEAIYKIFDFNKLYFKDMIANNIDFTKLFFYIYTRVFEIDYNFKMNYRIFDNNILVWTKKEI